jgi:hypothetical protein
VSREAITVGKPGGRRAPGLLFVLTVVGAVVIAAAPRAETGPPNEIVIYYGNETTSAAADSTNYGVLLAALRAHGGKEGADLAGAIAEDAKISPSVVGDEVKSLLNGCGRITADIAVFTNAPARDGRYLLCRAASQTVEARPFAALAPSPDAILNLTPLSRPEYFHAALEQIGALFAGRPPKAILLTHSHGSPETALMPRVSAEVTDLPPATLRHILDLRDSKPNWAALKGTSKLQYWPVLSDVESAYGMRFALVFRQACESGLDGFAEFGAIPQGVSRIAHTAMSDLPYGKIDYHALVRSAAAAPGVATAFAANLAAQGMHVDTKWRLLVWLAPVYLWSLPSAIWFAPIGLWLGWMTWTFSRQYSARKLQRWRVEGR